MIHNSGAYGRSAMRNVRFDMDQPIPFVYRGTPFTDTEYRPGTATNYGKADITAPMRYNAQQNVIEFLDQDQTQRELLRRAYISGSFGGKTYVIISYLEQGIEKMGYAFHLNARAAKLFFMPKKNIEAGSRLSRRLSHL